MNQEILESLELFKNSRHWIGKVSVVTDFQDHIQLESDPEQLRQVLWNLFLNACEAMSGGGSLSVSIRAKLDETHPDRRQIEITVRDTGDGFNDKAKIQAFTPFFTTKEEGSGLGLAIVKRIVEGLHGKVYASNHPDGGAEISILLPVSPPNLMVMDESESPVPD